MAKFTIDLKGRVKNFDLKRSKPLLPLFEAVVNSIYAIEERRRIEQFEGKIDIIVIREPQEVLEGVSKEINDIIGFKIIDNGIGFDSNNMKSFLQSDSTYRAAKGGKGIGRFSWLKAFENVYIDSTFKDDDGCWVRRDFYFNLDDGEIDDTLTEVNQRCDYETTVFLQNYYHEYRRNVPKNIEVIANTLMHHCLIYLIGANCPEISIIDEERICINSIFEGNIEKEEKEEIFQIEDHSFSILHTKVKDKTIAGNKLFSMRTIEWLSLLT